MKPSSSDPPDPSDPHQARLMSAVMLALMGLCAAVYFLLPNRGAFFTHIWAWVLSWR